MSGKPGASLSEPERPPRALLSEGDRLSIALMIEVDQPGPGGAEMMLLHLARALRADGHHVVTVGPVVEEGWLSSTLRADGFKHFTFVLRGPIDPFCALDLARKLRSERVTVVHSHEFTMGFYGTIAAGLLGARSVVTMHGGREYAGRSRRRIAMRWALRRCDAAVAVSAATKEDLLGTLGMFDHEVTVVANGIPTVTGERESTRLSMGVGDEVRVILTVGRAVPVKGHNVLVEAAAQLTESLPHLPIEVWIAGDGEAKAATEKLVAERGLGGVVRLLGSRSDVGDLLAAADVFALPSLSEGMPLALIEAMLSSTPVVASRVGGIPELIEDPASGYLASPGDPAAFAEALRRCLEDGPAARSAAQRAFTKAAARFGVAEMKDRYLGLYRP